VPDLVGVSVKNKVLVGIIAESPSLPRAISGELAAPCSAIRAHRWRLFLQSSAPISRRCRTRLGICTEQAPTLSTRLCDLSERLNQHGGCWADGDGGREFEQATLAKEKLVAGTEARVLCRDMLEFNWESHVETLTQRLHFDRQLATRLIHERAPSATIRSLGLECAATTAWHRADVVGLSETRTRRVLGQ
jgi:hypothetical protein